MNYEYISVESVIKWQIDKNFVYYILMKSSKQTLCIVSSSNYQKASHPRFGKDVDALYSKGYTKGFSWVDEMCEYYFMVEKNLVSEFEEHLKGKLVDVEKLDASEYKEGLKASLSNALESFKKD